MLKKIVIMFIIVLFISVSVFATVPVNSDNVKKETQFSKKSVTLSDQELENLNGQGWFTCTVATVTWTSLVMASPAGFAAAPAGYTVALSMALKAMYDECNILR